MAKTDVDAGSGGPRSLRLAAAELAEAIRDVGQQDGRSWVATVTDASFQASGGFVYAAIGSSEVTVLAWSTPLAAGDQIIVKKFDNSQNSPYVLEEFAADSDSNVVEYGLDFPAPQSSPNGRFYAKWGGTIRQIATSGVATFALTVGGSAVVVGDTVAAGSWVLVAATAGSDSDSAVAVMIG